MDQHLTVKLTDFSLVQKLSENGQYIMKDGGSLPVRWMSPESLLYGIYTVHTDCWYVRMYLGSNYVRLLYKLFNYMSNVMMILVLIYIHMMYILSFMIPLVLYCEGLMEYFCGKWLPMGISLMRTVIW